MHTLFGITLVLYLLKLSAGKGLLKQLASSSWIKSLDNQLASSLLTTCSRLVIIKPEQTMRTYPDIDLMTARQQACSGLSATCAFLAVYYINNLYVAERYHKYKQKHPVTRNPLVSNVGQVLLKSVVKLSVRGRKCSTKYGIHRLTYQ